MGLLVQSLRIRLGSLMATELCPSISVLQRLNRIRYQRNMTSLKPVLNDTPTLPSDILTLSIDNDNHTDHTCLQVTVPVDSG